MFWKKTPQSLASAHELQQKIGSLSADFAAGLAANREGKLSAAQQAEYAAMLARGKNVMLIFIPLMLLVVIGVAGWQVLGSKEMGGGNLRDAFGSNPIIPILGIGISLLLFVLVMGYYFMQTNRSPASLKVHRVSGRIKLTAYEGYGAGMAIASAAGVNTRSIMIQVGRQKVYATNPAVEDALENGAEYHIYFFKMSSIGYFVAAEPAGL